MKFPTREDFKAALHRLRSSEISSLIQHDRGLRLGHGAAATVCVLVASLAAFSFPYGYHGSAFNPPRTAPDFALSDQFGGTYELSEKQGRVVALYFGFTNCLDECPAAMALFKQVRAGLGADAGLVDFLFVTVDPARDSAEQLAAFLDKFDPEIIGLTGPQARMAPVWQSYGVYIDVQNEVNGTSVTHSTPIYLIDREGRLRLTYDLSVSARDLQGDIQQMLAEKCPRALIGVSC
jgi:protein SCO1